MGQAKYVRFYDTHEAVIDEMRKLAKGALRAGGRALMKQLRANTPKNTGKASKVIGQWARIDRRTGQPRLDIGYYTRKYAMKRKGINLPTNYIALLEDGTKRHTITAGVRSSRGKIRKRTGARLLSDGTHVYGRVASHPGAKPYRILRDTVKNGAGELHIIMEQHMRELNKALDKIKSDGAGEAIDDA